MIVRGAAFSNENVPIEGSVRRAFHMPRVSFTDLTEVNDQGILAGQIFGACVPADQESA